jgi:hypothetical protein
MKAGQRRILGLDSVCGPDSAGANQRAATIAWIAYPYQNTT